MFSCVTRTSVLGDARPSWLWKLGFNLNSGCLRGGDNCIEYSSVVGSVFCITRLLTFDCKLAVRISQWNNFFLLLLLKKGSLGCIDSRFSPLWKIRHFNFTCSIDVSGPLYIILVWEKKRSDQLEYCVCARQTGGDSELYVLQKVTTYGLCLILTGGKWYCNGANFIDNKLCIVKLPLGCGKFVFLMNLGFPWGWAYTVYFAIVTSRPTDQIVVLRYLTFLPNKIYWWFLFHFIFAGQLFASSPGAGGPAQPLGGALRVEEDRTPFFRALGAGT